MTAYVMLSLSDKESDEDFDADIVMNEEAIHEDLVEAEKRVSSLFANAVELNVTYFQELTKLNPGLTLKEFTENMKSMHEFT